MASTCDPLIKPVMLLTELMGKGEDARKANSKNQRNLINSTTIKWIPLEQTEPLNLSVNGQLIPVVKFYIDGAQAEESSDDNDDDVIFVKEYRPIVRKMEEKLSLRRRGLKNFDNKGEPRRNPIRKARNAKRFKEFTSLDDEDFTNESEEEESPTVTFNSSGEDAQDWNENDLKKLKPKRKTPIKKPSPSPSQSNGFVNKTGRRKKLCTANGNNAENKVTLDGLEDLILSNLISLKDFIRNVDFCREIISSHDRISDGIKSSAMDMVKNQALLLAITKNVEDLDVLQSIL